MARKKKAWNNTNPLYRYLHSKKSSSSRRKSGTQTMARRKKSKSYKNSGSKNWFSAVKSGGIYGFVRPMIAPKVIPMIADKLPANMQQYAPQISMGLVSWAANKWGSGEVKSAGYAGLCTESANVSSGMQTANGTTSSSANGMTFY